MVTFAWKRGSYAFLSVNTCFQLPNWHDIIFGIFPLLLIFKFSFRVRFKIWIILLFSDFSKDKT